MSGATEDKTATDDRAGRDRSPPFPFISLGKAIERARAFETHYKKAAGRIVNVLPLWDYTVKSSGGQQTIGALKAFGILEDEGSGADRKVKLTELALRILKDERPGKRDEAVKEAALKPKPIAEHWKLWGCSRPPDAECKSELTLERGYTDEAAERFLRVYDETIAFAKLAKTDNVADKNLEEPRSGLPKVGDLVQWESRGVLQFPEPKRVVGVYEDHGFLLVEGSSTGVPISEVTVVDASKGESGNNPGAGIPAPTIPLVPKLQDTWNLDEGTVVLQYPAKMSATSYEDFESWIQLQLRKIKRGIEQ